MKKIFSITILLTLLLTINSCSKDYFDVNTPSGAATEEQLSASDFMAPTIFHTIRAQYYAERSFGNYSQYFTGQGGGAAGKTSNGGAWVNIYLYSIPNLKIMMKKAEENNAIHYDAVAKILMAVNIGLATDSWDWIPYSEAGLGSENIHPAFDSQESIYQEIESLLTDAINQLEADDNSGFEVGSEDIVYGGNLSKWLKAAYTLRARYRLHLMYKNNMSNLGDILSDLDNGFTSNNDDFQMFFEAKNMNPWYSREILSRATGNDHDKIGDQLVSYMNGTSYPFTGGVVTEDPRLPVYAEKDDPTAPWRGYVSGGQGLSSDGNDANTDFKEDGFYTNLAAPIVVISYAEAQFIKAEVAFLENGGNTTSVGSNATAYNAYLEGISANMSKLGVDATDYLADPTIAMGEANLKLEHIMKEKYIANFLNPETYVDLRRYDFSPDVFKDFELPADNADSEFPGEWFLRAVYPSSEENRNGANVNAHKESPTTPVWWDQ